MNKTTTHRGFALIEFEDHNGEQCSLQKSSVATEDLIWLGVNDAKPKILASQTPEGGTGWVRYDVPEEVLMTTRMHLTRRQSWNIGLRLIWFALGGRVE